VLEFVVFFILVEGAGGGIVGDVDVGPAIVVEIGGEDAEAVGAVGLEDAGGFGDIAEGTVTVVVEENVFAADEAGGSAGDEHSFVITGAGFGDGRGGEIHVDVIGDEEIELAVAIVIDECAAGIPALATGGDAGFFADVGESAVAIVVIENIFAEVGDEEIFEAIVVVVADADTLAPAVATDAGLRGDIGESAITIIFKEVGDWFLAKSGGLELATVDKENVEPAVVVIVVEGDAAAGGFEEIFIFVFAAVDGFGVEGGVFGDVEKIHAEGRVGGGSGFFGVRTI